MLALAAGDYALTLDPGHDGALMLAWRGQPLLRRAGGPRNRALPLRGWGIGASTPRSATLLHHHVAEGVAYIVSQAFALDAAGLTMTLSLVNLGRSSLPADLAFGFDTLDAGMVCHEDQDTGPVLLAPGAVRSASLRLRATAPAAYSISAAPAA